MILRRGSRGRRNRGHELMKKLFLSITLCMAGFLLSSCASPETALTDSTVVEASEPWSPLKSFRGNGLIHCGSEEEDHTFEIHARDGSFLVEQEGGKSLYAADLVIEGSGDAHWQYFPASDPAMPWEGTKTFLEVLIMKNGQYVGYAVVAVERPEDIWSYRATVVACKEALQEKSSADALSKEALQQTIDDVIENTDRSLSPGRAIRSRTARPAGHKAKQEAARTAMPSRKAGTAPSRKVRYIPPGTGFIRPAFPCRHLHFLYHFHINPIIIPLRDHLEPILLVEPERRLVAASHLDAHLLFRRSRALLLHEPDDLL